MSIFNTKAPAAAERAPDFTRERLELYVPTELRPYIDTARERAQAAVKAPGGRAWIVGAESRAHMHVATAIIELDYAGTIPGTLTAPDTFSRKVLAPPRTPSPSWRQEWIDDPSLRDEHREQLAAYRADQAARVEFDALVNSTVEDILRDPVRALDAAVHFIALEEAAHMRTAARAQDAAALERTVRYTDPVTGACEPVHGDIQRRSVLPAIPGWDWDSWYTVESSAVTHLAIQHRLAERILEAHPDIAASVDSIVDDMLRRANL